MIVLELVMIVLMDLICEIRKDTGEKLFQEISLGKIRNCLNGLFVDRTAIDTSLRRFMNKDALAKVKTYNDCLNLNDERTIAFNKHFGLTDDVDVNNNMFIARDGVE